MTRDPGHDRPAGGGRDRVAVLARLVAPPGPASPAARATWAGLDDRTRRVLRRAATDARMAATVTDVGHRRVLRDLARSRAAGGPADLLGPVLTGLLVLSTLWGFGRAVFPADADAWLVAGLVGLGLTVAVGRRRVVVRRRDATAVLRALDERP